MAYTKTIIGKLITQYGQEKAISWRMGKTVILGWEPTAEISITHLIAMRGEPVARGES